MGLNQGMRAIALCLFALVSAPSLAEFACVPFQPTEVSLEGTIISRSFPGRPSFESIAGGDEKLVYWLLKLDKPVCVGTPDSVSEINTAESKVREIQIGPREADFYKWHEGAVGRHALIKGTLFHQHTAWHVTKIVVQVNDLRLIERGAKYHVAQ